MYYPSSLTFRPSLFFEILLSLDRFICNRLGAILLLPLLIYKWYVRGFPPHQVPIYLLILACFVFVNCTRVAAGSFGNATGAAHQFVWFWLLLPFVFVGHIYMVALQPLVLLYDRIYVGAGLVLSLLELLWSFVLFITSNCCNPSGEDHLAVPRGKL